MVSRRSQRALVLSATLGLAHGAALPEPTAAPAPVQVRAPVITPAAIRFDSRHSYVQRRDLFDDIKSGVDNVAHSWASVLGTDLPSLFTEGIPGWFDGLPTGTQVLSKLGIGDDLAAKPTEVLNVPPYANWTDQGWNVRFHGNVYKFPDISQSKIDELANVFLIDTSVDKLPADQQAQARNLTRSIYIVQQGDQNVSMSLEPAPSQGGDGEPGGGNAITAPGGTQNLTLPYKTTAEGDFDVFLPIEQNGLLRGNETSNVQRLNVYTNGTLSGNATAFLVPTEGITFISDIDDILRVTKIYDPKEGLLNSFARPFVPWMNMPEIYANWSRTLPNNTHFHYLTTTPEQATRLYMDYIYKTYPGGSFDTRPLNFSDGSATLSIRKFLLTKVFETFPKRKFVLVADTSNSDVMTDYPQLAHDYPQQVQCIFLRNTSATDKDMWFPYNTKGFEGLNNKSYMFFREPNDLAGLDIYNGQCLNETIPQNVTFSRQAEILGIYGDSAGGKLQSSATVGFVVALVVALLTTL
ncbi:Nn.00g112790.m01.CDS01 [Neocucurbitaria sp. VM-36]